MCLVKSFISQNQVCKVVYDEKKKIFEERWKKVDEGKKEMKQNLGSLPK